MAKAAQLIERARQEAGSDDLGGDDFREGLERLIHALVLGEDASFRSLRNWEAMNPCPPPDSATANDDPRIALAEAAMKQREEIFSRMSAMLPSNATSPTECQ